MDIQLFWDVMQCYLAAPEILRESISIIFSVKQSKKNDLWLFDTKEFLLSMLDP
jgi:hypothetical protein